MKGLHERGRKALLTINRALAGGIPSQGIFEAIIAEAATICRAERGFLILNHDEVVAHIHPADGRFSRAAVRLVWDSKEPLLTLDALEDPRMDRSESIVDQHIRSVMAAPVVSDGRMIGVIYLDSRSSLQSFMESDLELLSAFADQAALALKIATLKRELEDQLLEARQLSQLADRDGLTGLMNRRAFDRQLETLLGLNRDGMLALIMIDVDHFKHYNDNNGHPAGDEVLRTLARLIESGLRVSSNARSDLAARYGGEEFAVILDATSLSAAQLVAERLRMQVEEHPFAFRSHQPGKRLTISAGVALTPLHAETPGALVEAADKALYHAKGLGRNRVVIAD